MVLGYVVMTPWNRPKRKPKLRRLGWLLLIVPERPGAIRKTCTGEAEKRAWPQREREKKEAKRKVQRRRAPAALVQGLAHLADNFLLAHPTRTSIRRNDVVTCEEMEEAKKLTWEQKVERVPRSEWASAGWKWCRFCYLVVQSRAKLKHIN